MDRFTEVMADLAAESELLDDLVAPLDEAGWRTATPAAGWDVATQIAHLAWTDEATVAATQDGDRWDRLLAAAAADTGALVEDGARTGAAETSGDILARWRRSRTACAEALRGVPEGTKVPWFGPPMSATSMATARFMETWAHSVDVHEGLGVPSPRSDRVRHVAFLGAVTRGFAFLAHGRPVPEEPVLLVLTLPSGAEWRHGDPDATNQITGSAHDFALRVTQRRHRDDLDLVARGTVAGEWLDVAQAFAGPPGRGRPSVPRNT